MKVRWNRSICTRSILLAGLAVVSSTAIGQDQSASPAPAQAHGQNQSAPAAPRAGGRGGRGGRGADMPSVPWKPVYLSDGEPDWSGFWRANPGGDTYTLSGNKDRPDYLLQGNGEKRPGIHRIPDTPDGEVPYLPWAAAKHKELFDHADDPIAPRHIDTQAHCLLAGPGRQLLRTGFEIVQAPGYIVFVNNQNDEPAITPIDGGPHIGSDIKLWQGDRRGHWEDNKTLVVDITNVKGLSRLDMTGDFYGPSTHFVERFTRVNDNTIQYEVRVTDPTIYTQTWTITGRFQRVHADDPTFEQWEDACHEGERDNSSRWVIPPEAAKANAAAAAKAAAAKKSSATPPSASAGTAVRQQ